jgi:ABC-type Zn uptake system ZnuABC Zn-binding protein ZnuA
MQRRMRGLLAGALSLIAATALAQPLVVATTPDLKAIVDAVSGGTVRTAALVPPGADPEAFEPRPSHLGLVREAELLVRVGLGYDEWVQPLLARADTAKTSRRPRAYVDLSRHIALLEVQGRSIEQASGHTHGAANPHYWLDPVNGDIIGAVIAEALITLTPDGKAKIEAAQMKFSSDLRDGIERWTRRLEQHQGAPIVSYHNSWPYLARRFRLDIVDAIEPKGGVAPSVSRLASLAARMRKAQVRLIVREPTAPAAAAQFLAERTGANVVVLAPSVGSLPGTDDYVALFDYNVAILANALTGTP